MKEPGSGDEPQDGAQEDVRELAALWCFQLGLRSPTSVRQLREGRSGSLVLGLEVSGAPVVVKVTRDRDRLTCATREADLLGSQALVGIAPELVASATGPDWVAIATRACAPLRPATDTDLRTWMAISTSLAEIHQRAVDAVTLPVRRASGGVFDDDSLEPWADLGSEDEARRAAQQVVESAESPLPPALEHGDAHVDNALRDADGRLVWVDWQESCIGDGVSDLVFCWQRAEFAGARPPRAEMTVAYAKERGLDRQDLRPLVDRAELRLLIGSWPPFLRYGTPASRVWMKQRLMALVSG